MLGKVPRSSGYWIERLALEKEFVGSNSSQGKMASAGFFLLLPPFSLFSYPWLYQVSGVSHVVPL